MIGHDHGDDILSPQLHLTGRNQENRFQPQSRGGYYVKQKQKDSEIPGSHLDICPPQNASHNPGDTQKM